MTAAPGSPAAIRPLADGDVEAVVALSLRAWAPVFASIEEAYGPALFRLMHPGGHWRPVQEAAVRRVLATQQVDVAVLADGAVAGFVAVALDPDERIGEVHMLAVDPAAQRRGIATALIAAAVERIRAAGMAIALVETGGDPGHAPARRTYEAAGFRHVEVARYFLAL